MFYKRNVINGKIGVVDTQDGVCEYYTQEELDSFGVVIEPFLPADFQQGLNIRMLKKLYYMASRGEVSEFFSKYCLPCVDSKDTILGLIKYWSYHETNGLIVLALQVERGVCILVIREDGYSWNATLCGSWRFSFYPIGSGRLYNILFKRVLGLDINLDEKLLYILCYSSTGSANIIRVKDLAIKEICVVKEDLK